MAFISLTGIAKVRTPEQQNMYEDDIADEYKLVEGRCVVDVDEICLIQEQLLEDEPGNVIIEFKNGTTIRAVEDYDEIIDLAMTAKKWAFLPSFN